MSFKRKKMLALDTAAKMKAISSPVAIEIVQALRQIGPASVSELGPAIGRKPNSLHYHVNKLVENGLVAKTGSQMSGARTETVYDVTAEKFLGGSLNTEAELKEYTKKSVNTILRLAARNYEKAVTDHAYVSEKGKKRNLLVQRLAGRLTGEQLAEINGLVDRIMEIFADNVASKDGKKISLTLAMTPLETDGDK
ncbi:MAG: helix-turn-helix transcriptional regulator [Aridibacter famidurans]|nr:helix-turn-helix transcriptional regulator [Aridibacter famidurans]